MGFSGKLLAEQRCRIGFGEQPGFEIETRRQVVIGVGGTREAIDAAMFASPIGIDRLAEGDVGGIVAADDGAGAFDGHLRAPSRRCSVYVDRKSTRLNSSH